MIVTNDDEIIITSATSPRATRTCCPASWRWKKEIISWLKRRERRQRQEVQTAAREVNEGSSRDLPVTSTGNRSWCRAGLGVAGNRKSPQHRRPAHHASVIIAPGRKKI